MRNRTVGRAVRRLSLDAWIGRCASRPQWRLRVARDAPLSRGFWMSGRLYRRLHPVGDHRVLVVRDAGRLRISRVGPFQGHR